MSSYSDLALVASRIIKDKGQLVTISQTSSTAFDPTTGETQKNINSFTGNGVSFNYNKSEINESTALKGDVRFMLEATATEPKENDTLLLDGDVYRVMSVNLSKYAGVVVKYELQLRK